MASTRGHAPSEKDAVIGELARHVSLQCSQRMSKSKTVFDSSVPVELSLHAYLERFGKYLDFSPATYIGSLVLLDRICHEMNIVVTMLNAHRLICTSLLLSMKMLEDLPVTSTCFAKISGVSRAELLRMEIFAFKAVRYSCHVSEEEIIKICSQMAARTEDDAARYQLNNLLRTLSECR